MISVGFDPSFIDTIVTARSTDGSLLKDLPPVGYHHRNNEITRVAGGNGVNVGYVLQRLNNQVEVVVPSNRIFEELLTNRGVDNIHPIPAAVNETVVVQWAKGEIQFNQVRAKLDKNNWTEVIHNKWINSSMHVYLNWGLNPTSPIWVACQWLAACGWGWEEIQMSKNLITEAKSTIGSSCPVFMEPGSIKHHPNQKSLQELMEAISKAYADTPNLFVFSCNKEESNEYNQLVFPRKVVHTAQYVTLQTNQKSDRYPVPPLEDIIVFVGAGDAFLSGLIHSYLTSAEIDVDLAINVAQDYMVNNIQ